MYSLQGLTYIVNFDYLSTYRRTGWRVTTVNSSVFMSSVFRCQVFRFEGFQLTSFQQFLFSVSSFSTFSCLSKKLSIHFVKKVLCYNFYKYLLTLCKSWQNWGLELNITPRLLLSWSVLLNRPFLFYLLQHPTFVFARNFISISRSFSRTCFFLGIRRVRDFNKQSTSITQHICGRQRIFYFETRTVQVVFLSSSCVHYSGVSAI